jgi:hypothetical protein
MRARLLDRPRNEGENPRSRETADRWPLVPLRTATSTVSLDSVCLCVSVSVWYSCLFVITFYGELTRTGLGQFNTDRSRNLGFEGIEKHKGSKLNRKKRKSEEAKQNEKRKDEKRRDETRRQGDK